MAKPMSRRQFLGTAASAMAATAVLPVVSYASPRWTLPPLDIKGVKVGAISYSFRSIPGSAEEILEYMVNLGLHTIELMGGPAEVFAGAPAAPAWPRRSGGGRPSREEMEKFREARALAAKESKKWRMSATMDRFEALGKMYNDAGVHIDILKLGRPDWSDAEIDYAFKAAKAVGARGISFEISDEAGERMGPFATKHKMYTGMHNHTQVAKEGFTFEKPLSFSSYNMLNLDIGHYVAGLSKSPIPVIKKYHDRITHLHLKDRKNAENGGANVPWGEGDTPIAEVLRLLQKEQYPITAMIELEYEIPEGSDVLKEMARCVAFCREALS